MRKKTLIAFVLTAGFWAVSCSSDDNTSAVNPYEKFQGTWTGTFSGDDEGTWTATFDSAGKATGTLESNTVTFPFDLEAQVSENGEITAEYSSGGRSVGTMDGILTETTASGTWKSPEQNAQGTWEGSKN
ncbi:MAG TPA: hypothetical protein VKY33_02670 [Flavobacterium sp.]|nr:hypothetical protein [Flavobacterium sp.]